MGECELCGSKGANLKTKIDGAVLNVCKDCVGYGQPIATVSYVPQRKILRKLEGEEIEVKSDLKETVRRERSKRKMTQDDLARALSEKLSVIKRIEEGWEPPTGTLKKLEKFFGIVLTEDVEERKIESRGGKASVTIGDLVDLR
jgi:putative transcription factor